MRSIGMAFVGTVEICVPSERSDERCCDLAKLLAISLGMAFATFVGPSSILSVRSKYCTRPTSHKRARPWARVSLATGYYPPPRQDFFERFQIASSGGGSKPPNFRSIISAKRSGVRSSYIGPRTWTPIGSPSSDRPMGSTVDGNPGAVAIPAHTS